jgi:hypothetical protein
VSQMKTFRRPPASNEQRQKSGKHGALLLKLALYSNPKLLSVVRAAVERLTETLGFPATIAARLTTIFEIYENEEQALAA